VPVFRPLISLDKMEIVNIAERIGTYKDSVKEYQDCCSLVSVDNPITRARRAIVEEYYEQMKIGELIEQSVDELEILD